MAKPTLHGYFGGKSKFESFICPVIPKNIKKFSEPFAGSFAVYFLTDFYDNVEIIFNDLNRDQANLIACCRDYENFYKHLKYELEDIKGKLYCKETDESLIKTHYKELYYSLKKSNFRNESFNIPDMNRASYYAFLLTSAFSSCSYTAAGFSGFKLKTFLKKLQNKDLQKKLAKINIIETLGFEEVIKKYDSPETFMYLDPPYNSVEKKGSDDTRSGWYGTKDVFGQAEHIKLLELLKTTKSRWALSYYYFPALEFHLPKDQYVWLEKDFFRSSASFSDNKSLEGTELLILNYDPNHITSNTEQSEKLVDEIEEMNDGAFIGGNFVEEDILNQKITSEKREEILNSKYGSITEIDLPKMKGEIDINAAIKKVPGIDIVPVKPMKKDEDIDDFWNS